MGKNVDLGFRLTPVIQNINIDIDMVHCNTYYRYTQSYISIREYVILVFIFQMRDTYTIT